MGGILPRCKVASGTQGIYGPISVNLRLSCVVQSTLGTIIHERAKAWGTGLKKGK